MKKAYVTSFLLCATILISGCVAKQPIRSQFISTEDSLCQIQRDDKKKDYKNCGDQSFYKLNDGVKIAVLEINDFGIILQKDNVENLLNYINHKMNSKNKPIVDLYIHGWNHNGTGEDDNLKEFERANLAMYKSQGVKDEGKREVIGIYVSWRGITMPTKIINTTFTFWGRKAVSEEVGRGEFTSFISRLENIVKPEKIKESNKNGTLILVGHSFGASALYTAVQTELINRFYESLDAQKSDSKQKIQGFGDLIILLNPAIQALRFIPLREAVYKNASLDLHIFDNNVHPNLVVLSSDNDFPVRVVFPIGRHIAEAKNHHGDTEIFNGNSGELVEVSLRDLNTTAIGQYQPYFTHLATVEKKIDTGDNGIDVKDCIVSKDDNIKWLTTMYEEFPNSEDISNNTYTKFLITNNTKDRHLETNSKWLLSQNEIANTTWKRNPYWFVQVNKDFIDNHNDVWNRNVGCFTLLMLTTDRKEAETNTILTPNIK